MWHEMMSCNLTQNNACDKRCMWWNAWSCNLAQNNTCDMK